MEILHKVEEIIKKSVQMEVLDSEFFTQKTYYDSHNEVILEHKVFKEDLVSYYEINELTYDAHGNILCKEYTYRNSKVQPSHSFTYYQYEYDEQGNVVSKSTFDNNHKCDQILYYFYENNVIKKKEIWEIKLPEFCLEPVPEELVCYYIHSYDYDEEFKLLEETVTLSTGEVCYYVDYRDKSVYPEGKILNPVKSKYAWKVLSKDVYIEVDEEIYTPDVLREVVEYARVTYGCTFIVLWIKGNWEECSNAQINELVQYYRKHFNISINYTY